MKTPVLLAVDGSAEAYAPLFSAAKAAKQRIGWLALDASVDPPPPLEAPHLLEAFRAVAIGEGRAVSLKPMKGKPVLRDLLREYFLGADVILVSGLPLYPRLAARESGWHLAESATVSRTYTTEELLVRLRKPALRWKKD